MSVASREQLKQYALRALGAPVLEINVDDTQLEDRLDEALDYWHLYHYEGIEQIYMKAKIDASVLNLSTPVAETFAIAEIVTGATSGAVSGTTLEAKTYLANTDYKMLPNYVVKPEEDINDIITKRNTAREFIRNQGYKD